MKLTWLTDRVTPRLVHAITMLTYVDYPFESHSPVIAIQPYPIEISPFILHTRVEKSLSLLDRSYPSMPRGEVK